jgi:hypothetical protein
MEEHEVMTKNDSRPQVLQEFDAIRAVLSETHTEIPALLVRENELARHWIADPDELVTAQVEEVHRLKAASIRKRAASIEKIVALEPRLRAERERVAAELDQYAETAIAEFSRRYHAVIRQLQSLWEEGRMLAAKVGQDVDMPLPVRMISDFAGHPGMEPVRAENVKVEIDPEITRLFAKVHEVDQCLILIGAIRQSKRLDAEEFELARERHQPTSVEGAFVVLRSFVCQHDLEEFTPGTLIDRTLIGDGAMQRSIRQRGAVRPVTLASSLPAA